MTFPEFKLVGGILAQNMLRRQKRHRSLVLVRSIQSPKSNSLMLSQLLTYRRIIPKECSYALPIREGNRIQSQLEIPNGARGNPISRCESVRRGPDDPIMPRREPG